MEENKKTPNQDKEEANKNSSKITQEEKNTKESQEAKEEENKVQQTQDLRSIIGQMGDEEIAALVAKAQIADFYLDSLQRLKAEYENFQKRVERERISQAKYAYQPILTKLIQVLDIFETAIHAGTHSNMLDKGFFEGICLAYKEFMKILQDAGLNKIQAVGAKFNPLYHEAVQQRESSEHADMAVLEEIQSGYLFQDRLLRASKVIVSRKPKVECPCTEEKA
ncbi:MAG: nucleotide exchange factor GrpE [Candidatus Brocadiae bacterium]|nr:nucleotide exchange factor GrpE [Candidatus Brocadiia bacterium]